MLIFLLCFSINIFSFSPEEKDFNKIREFKEENILDISDIIISTKSSNINILSSTENKISALWQAEIATGFGFKPPHLIVSKKDKKISIKIDYGEKYDFLSENIKMRKAILSIKLPISFTRNLNISSISGEINIPKIINKDIHIEDISGNITAKHLDGNTIWLRNTSGNIDIDVLSGESSRIVNVSGDLNVKKATAKNLFIKTTNSEIKLEELNSYSEISAISSSINIVKLVPGNTLKINTISGNVNLITDKYTNKEFSFSTISGKIMCETEHVLDKKDRFSYSGHYMAGTSKKHSTIFISTVSGDINFKNH